ncbi:MAG: tetratricopeptide repeat protein [Oscillospiraceae bacterium]|jgi:tetratricopeptide (TPR) repeat protein|nr:tetratricopeptide repeat protein [Oscillospiraceae bacterium]
MGFRSNITSRKAVLEHQKGNLEAAKVLYEQAIAQGAIDAATFIPYASLLTRVGEYEKAVEYLKKAEKAPGVTPEQKRQIFMHYAAAQYKLGNLDRALEILWEIHRKNPTGTIYQTLGYLLVEKGDAETALAFNKEAVDYDDEDSVALDNLAQTYYRLLSDKASAKEYFDKAYKIKPTQVDTLYFLAMYDADDGNLDDAREKLETAGSGRISPLNYATKERIAEALAGLSSQRQPTGV